MADNSLGSQIYHNIVAIVSLLVACIALLYTTWREEITERNRNLRPAAFEVLKNLGELQLIVNNAYYADEKDRINPINGWGHVGMISDIGQLLPPPIPTQVDKLAQTWSENWKTIRGDEISADHISGEIDNTRRMVLEQLKNLK